MEVDNKTQSDDDLLLQFFDAQRFEIADDGFSKRVMQAIPQRARRLNRIWTALCFTVAMAMLLFCDWVDELRLMLSQLIGDLIGYLSVVEFNLCSIVMVLASLMVLSTVAIYNVLTNYDAKL